LVPTLTVLLSIAIALQPDSSGIRRVFEENLARRRQEFGAADPRTAAAARDLGLFLLKQGDRADGRRAMAEALKLDDASLGPNAPDTLQDAITLAGVSADAQAEPLLRRAIEAADAAIAGPALASLGGLRKAAGDHEGAAALYRRAVEKAEIVEGRSSPVVALILMQLATVAPRAEAVDALRRAVAVSRQALGPRHPQTIAAQSALDRALKAGAR